MQSGRETSNAQVPQLLSPAYAYAWLAFFVSLGLYLRIEGPTLGYGFSNDESFVLSIARGDSLADVFHYALYDSHPPLFYVFAHYWLMLFTSPAPVRCLPLIFGMGLIPLYYAIGRRTGGNLCAVCCAALAALSYGCIIQSCVMRDYSLLLLCLSLNFHCYLRWRETHQRRMIAAYAAFGCLAALSHFSAIPYFLSLNLFHCGIMLRSRAQRQKAPEWAAANLAIALPAAVLLYLWQPELTYYSTAFTPKDHPIPFVKIFLWALRLPFTVSAYLYPAFLMLPAVMLYAVLTWLVARWRSKFSLYFILLFIACLVCMAICLTHTYPEHEPRHNLWLVPFFILAAGGMLTELLERIKKRFGRYPLRIIAVCLALTIFCDVEKRIADGEFDAWQRGPWQEATHALDALGPRDVIITDKDGVNLLLGVYRYISDDAFMNSDMPEMVSYRNTHILLDPGYFGFYTPKAVRAMIAKAQAAHLLDNVERIVFVKLWSPPPFYTMALCKTLASQILYPPLARGSSLTRTHFMPTSLAVIAVPKAALFNDVLAPSGEAAGCLDEKDNRLPNYFIPYTARRPPAAAE